MRLIFFFTLDLYIGSTYSEETELQKCTAVNLNIMSKVELIEERAYPLWTNEYETYGAAFHHCFSRCENDERCIGIELCRIRPGSSRCRGCCEWFVNPHEGVPALKVSEVCRYIELVCVILDWCPFIQCSYLLSAHFVKLFPFDNPFKLLKNWFLFNVVK